jgi:hypothetical protein
MDRLLQTRLDPSRAVRADGSYGATSPSAGPSRRGGLAPSSPSGLRRSSGWIFPAPIGCRGRSHRPPLFRDLAGLPGVARREERPRPPRCSSPPSNKNQFPPENSTISSSASSVRRWNIITSRRGANAFRGGFFLVGAHWAALFLCPRSRGLRPPSPMARRGLAPTFRRVSVSGNADVGAAAASSSSQV